MVEMPIPGQDLRPFPKFVLLRGILCFLHTKNMYHGAKGNFHRVVICHRFISFD